MSLLDKMETSEFFIDKVTVGRGDKFKQSANVGMCLTEGRMNIFDSKGSKFHAQPGYTNSSFKRNGLFRIEAIEKCSYYCINPKKDDILWARYGQSLKAGEKIIIGKHFGEQRLFLLKGSMKGPTGTERSYINIWRIEPETAASFEAVTDCIIMRVSAYDFDEVTVMK